MKTAKWDFSDKVREKLKKFIAYRANQERQGFFQEGLNYSKYNQLSNDIVFAECAVARILGLKYRKYKFSEGRSDKFKSKRFTGLIVKTTRYTGGRIILKEDAYPDAIYILVETSGVPQSAKAIGWIYGHEGMKRNYRRSTKEGGRSFCFFVPNTKLHSIAELKKLIPTGMVYFDELIRITEH